jgi:NAD(P)-dependent dehydrogenase (short-subunit alcohol dehydrogenase family)
VGQARTVCVVTGAGRGIGRALSTHVAARGAAVAVCSRSEDELSAVGAEIESAGGRIVARCLDVGDATAVGAFAADVMEELGAPWAVVNNAAVLGPVGRLEDVEIDRWTAALLTDVAGVATVTRAFLPTMRERGGGRIVNLSGGGLGGPSLQQHASAYTASKGAVAILTEVLGDELRGSGITVNAVAPGQQPTSFASEMTPPVGGESEATLDLDQFFDLLDFVLSEDAGWLTGKVLSSRWDTVESLRVRRDRLVEGSLLNLRRIDDDLYTEVPR